MQDYRQLWMMWAAFIYIQHPPEAQTILYEQNIENI